MNIGQSVWTKCLGLFLLFTITLVIVWNTQLSFDKRSKDQFCVLSTDEYGNPADDCSRASYLNRSMAWAAGIIGMISLYLSWILVNLSYIGMVVNRLRINMWSQAIYTPLLFFLIGIDVTFFVNLCHHINNIMDHHSSIQQFGIGLFMFVMFIACGCALVFLGWLWMKSVKETIKQTKEYRSKNEKEENNNQPEENGNITIHKEELQNENTTTAIKDKDKDTQMLETV